MNKYLKRLLKFKYSSKAFKPVKFKHNRYEGYVDSVIRLSGKIVIAGWVLDKKSPTEPLKVRLLEGENILTEVVASRFRDDLKAAGKGSGNCAFRASITDKDNFDRIVICVGSERCRVKLDLVSYFGTEKLPKKEKILVDMSNQEITMIIGNPDSKDSYRFQLKPAGVTDAMTANPARIIGSVDRLSKVVVSGWAIDTVNKSSPVVLDLYIDGALYSTTETTIHRGDVQKHHECRSLSGFIFELPQNLENDMPVSLEIRSRVRSQDIKNSLTMIKPIPNARRAPPNGNTSIDVGSQSVMQFTSFRENFHKPRIALIILNLNGAKLLNELFRTFKRFNSYENVEILVVDHNSQDDSREIVDSYSKILPVKLLARDKNYSFSNSNNWAAQQSDADILIFTNNDIEFCQDILPRIPEVFDHAQIGMLGIKLLDKPLGSQAILPVAIQHLGVYYRSDYRDRLVMPFESRAVEQLGDVFNTLAEVPTVTGAFLACRREDFIMLGGFDEDYFYGYEDVDLCLRAIATLGKRVYCANHLSAIHHRGVTRKDPELDIGPKIKDNWANIESKLGFWLRRRMASELLMRPGFWTSRLPKIGFAVTDARDTAAAGDYFTALELARDIQKIFRCKIIFLDKEKQNSFDVNGLDYLIVMRDDYDLRKLINSTPRLITIGWARNWIDRWASRPWASEYHAYWASSELSSKYLSKKLARPVEVLPIATNYFSFCDGVEEDGLKSDYCFTGSYWGVSRNITEMLNPTNLPFQFGLFGHGWENHPIFSRYSRGGLAYSRMKDVYASTKIVIDDANSATKQWGSVNSRVFDALAAGALVVTNGKEGADVLFNGLLPTYESRDELEFLLNKYLTDEAARATLVMQLRKIVAEFHTYTQRAVSAKNSLDRLTSNQLRFSIKIGAPNKMVRDEWGDYHFAVGMGRALSRRGYAVRIDCLDEWERPEAIGDDVVIVLRGLSGYVPKPHQVNLMWNISHPDKISDDEFERYDHVFVASVNYTKELSDRVNVPVTMLLQCTDPEIFNPNVSPCEHHEVLFVGNSRKVFRKVVSDALDCNLPLSVYGTNWTNYLPQSVLKGTHIKNAKLAGYYANAGVVLNDHWDTMREYGFISNRLFDAAASGAKIVSDKVTGMEEIFGELVMTYENTGELKCAVKQLMRESDVIAKQRLELATHIAENHSFDARICDILQEVTRIVRIRTEMSAIKAISSDKKLINSHQTLSVA